MSSLAINKSTIGKQVVDELRQRIIRGQYPGGMKLQQEQIAQEFGISRSPVREALRHLEAEGLVTLISQKGAEVTPILLSEVSECFEMRLLVEPHLLALAIPNMTEADFAQADAIIADMEDTGIENWGVLNWQLHRALYRAAERPTILRALERIHQNVDRYLRVQIFITDGRALAKAEHADLVQLCRRQQVERAVSLLRMHILNAASNLTELIRARSEPHAAAKPADQA